jgi:hydroxyacylglutathione hydrolase
MRFVFEQIRTGGDRNLAYLIGDRVARVAAVIDPSFDPERVVDRATAQGLVVKYVINTHGHPDHVNGNDDAKRRTNAPIAGHERALTELDLELEDQQEILLGSILLRFLHTPGHADDHLVIHLPQQKIAVTGDLLFVGKVGGTSNDADAAVEFESLQRALRELPDDTTIWPGHDYGCRPSSTMALERATNPFLIVQNVAEFLDLKARWPAFKAKLGLR